LRPGLLEYGWPSRTAQAEKASFKLQCDKFIEDGEVPSDQERKAIIDEVNRSYIRHILPDYLQKYDRNLWSLEIDKLKTHIKPQASPGVPYAMCGLQNEQVFDWLGESFNDIVLDRIETRLRFGSSIKSFDRKERIDLGICDPVRIFVKGEPHKLKKLEEGRVRLIMSVSLVDKIIEMLLSRHLHKLEIANWYHIPSKPGIGFTPAMNEIVYTDIASSPNMAYTDISGWDWSCKTWLMEDAVKAKILLCDNPSLDWSTLVLSEFYIESESVYQFSDGEMVTPNFKGIVNSGKYKTSRDNSWMRVCLATHVGSKKVIANGDDTVESYVDDAVAKYLKLGWRLKDYQKVKDGFEFCSRWYQAGASYPLNCDKVLMNLLYTSPKNEFEKEMYMLQFIDQLEFHPEFPQLMELLSEVNYGPDEQDGAQ